jgi:hypothetical protein
MIRDFSNEIVVSLKDRLRDVRHLIRSNRQGVEPSPQNLPEILFGKAARVVDKALTTAETISISLVSQDPAAHNTTIEARGLDFYFPAGAAPFRRDAYYLTKRLLGMLGDDNALIHEATFSTVHAAMLRRHAARLQAAINNRGLNDIAMVSAILACELQSHYSSSQWGLPALHEGQPDKLTLSLCFSSIALAIGLATYADHEPGEEKLVESALLALQARQDRFDATMEGPDRIQALSDLFAFLIPHLP